ncbi:CG17786 [Drosophila busckii]|uniref:CG17786 n=1 Tax=Drosophila busckii TaxID=30019 RepID=A0A0M4EP64_DROBS|nr:basic-leucine zipper transcription factor A [Drosophila busckii]ALC45835.1 CG17786 [Drosophila busckii]
MRSHVAVYRAPDNAAAAANGCHYARYALNVPPTQQQQQQQLQQQQQQQQQQHALWSTAQQPAAACYNLRANLYHATAAAAMQHQQQQQQQQQHHHHQQQQQQLLVNQCAGIPLISNACSHLTPAQRQRLLRKAAKPWPPAAAAAAAVAPSISRLAVHAQGLPLLQAQKQQQQPQQQHLPLHAWPAYQPVRHNLMQLTDKSRVLRYQNSAPAALCPPEQQQQQQQSLKEETTTAAATESCLPRIIKPRKRRKKDRKPANGVLLKMDAELQPKLQQQQQQQQQQHQLLPLQHDHSHGVCFCRDCDPLLSPWDFTLRRSHSNASSSGQGSSSSSTTSTNSADNSCASSICSQSVLHVFDETEHFAPITGDSSRADIVGVIGSQRSSATATTTIAAATSATACLSDSNDSGYGDILSGMNIANDLFASCFGQTTATANGSNANAETLLNESINEISRKLIETCAVNEPATAAAAAAAPPHPPAAAAAANIYGDCNGDSCSASASSDSGLDSAGSYNSESLVFSFEHLNLMDTNLVTPTALDYNNNNIGSSSSSNNKQQQFYNNCFDLVWRSSNNNDNQVTAAKGVDNSATPTSLLLGSVGKLKPAFSTIS